MKRNIPVCFCHWISEVPDDKIRKLVVKSKHEADIELCFPRTRDQFVKAISNWYDHSTNAQYLFITTHGIKGDGGRVVGIGSDGDEEHQINWTSLWNLVVKPKRKPPNVHIMGCRVTDGIEIWNGLITRRNNIPYFVGYNRKVTKPVHLLSIAKALRLILSFLRTTPPIPPLDEEIQRIMDHSAQVDVYLPFCLDGVKPHFVNTRTMMPIKQYLDERARQISEQ